jgi:polar amino acid transport system substrate-binding protein
MQGILIDVLTEVLQKQMGINLSHQGYPWARAQQYVRNGDADAFATVPTPERRTYTVISTEPVITAEFTLFTYNGNPKLKQLQAVHTVEELGDFTLVHFIGSGWAKENLKRMNVTWVPTLQKSLFLLAEKKYDVFVDASQVIRFNVKDGGYNDKIVEVANSIDSKPFNLCIGKNSPYTGILPKFDKIIRRLKQEGTLQRIYDRYR